MFIIFELFEAFLIDMLNGKIIIIYKNGDIKVLAPYEEGFLLFCQPIYKYVGVASSLLLVVI